MSVFMSKVIRIVFRVMMMWVVGLCIFAAKWEYVCKVDFSFSNITYGILGCLVFLLIGFVSLQLGKVLEKNKYANLKMFLSSILYCVGLIWLTYNYYFVTGWDANVVEMNANNIVLQKWDLMSNFYYSYCPNNMFLTYLFSLGIRFGNLLGIADHYFSVIVMQCILFALTGYLLYLAISMWTNIRRAVTVWTMYILVVGLSPWVIVPYSDSTGLIFPALLFYLYTLILKKKHVMHALFGMALCTYMGYYIKPQTVILVIAVCAVSVFELNKEHMKGIKKWLPGLAVTAAGLFLGMVLVSGALKATHIEADENCSYGMLHYLMMGLNAEAGGVINWEDQEISINCATPEERVERNIEVIKERLTSYGPKGILRMFKNKTLTNFSDGTFAWWKEGNVGGFLVEGRNCGNLSLRSKLSSYIYEGGVHYYWFQNYSQTLWMGVLVLALISALLPKEEKRRELDVLRLSLIGIFIFELLFEARARYIFIYVPFFVIAAESTVNFLLMRIWMKKYSH